jgi:hypothetical protein
LIDLDAICSGTFRNLDKQQQESAGGYDDPQLTPGVARHSHQP